MHRYPETTVATIQDFTESGWKAAIATAERTDYAVIWQSLSEAARNAMNSGEASKAKVLWLLADSCSMMLKPKSINEPFAPLAVMNGRRSAMPEDFSESELVLLVEIVDGIDDAWLRSRVADIVWLCKKPRDVAHAITAIDAYRSIPIDEETWVHGARECWERAIALSLQLRGGAGTRLDEIESAVLEKFDKDKSRTGFFRLSLSRLLFDNFLAREHGMRIGDELANLGALLKDKGAHYNARSYFEGAADWYGRSKNADRQADMTCAVAETWVSEAIVQTSGDQPSQMVASGFYENAIQAYRRVPRIHRAERNVDARITQLHADLETSGKASLHEMTAISSGPIEITEIAETAQATIRGKSLLDALFALANIHAGARREKLASSALKSLQEYPLQALFSTTHMSRDGRVVAKRPGIGLGAANSAEYKTGLRAEMVKHYTVDISLIVQGQIWPALHAFTLEHRLREGDLVQLVSQSPIVPDGRASIIAKALFAGFERDFVNALHLLVPQVEHLVRWHLKSAGAKTTTLSAEGVENENGLSTLVDFPEVEQVFGDDLSFELKSLFCDAFGPNLRNELAHGLMNDDDCQTAQAVYAWWLLLRIVVNTFWNAAHQKTPEVKQSVPSA